jgi:hypothetical protein
MVPMEVVPIDGKMIFRFWEAERSRLPLNILGIFSSRALVLVVSPPTLI